MRKLLLAGGAAIGAVLLARRCKSRCGGFDFERLIERMPENAPPKATREKATPKHPSG